MKRILLILALVAGFASAAELTLNWTDNSDNEEGFLIERSADGVDFLSVAQTLMNTETYTDKSLEPSTEYFYRVRAYNSFGNSGATNIASAVTQADGQPPSDPGPLQLVVPGRMTNISSRGLVTVASGTVIGGFVIVDGPVKVLVRAVGPTLADYGISEPISNPRVALLLPDGTKVLENEKWSGTDISDAAAQVGAFPLPVGSLDAAFLINLPPGTYTTHVSGVDGVSGVGLLEIYAVD